MTQANAVQPGISQADVEQLIGRQVLQQVVLEKQLHAALAKLAEQEPKKE